MKIFTGELRQGGQRLRRLLVRTARDFCRQRLLLVAGLAGLASMAGGCAAVGTVSSAVTTLNPSDASRVFDMTEARLQQKNFVVVKANVMGQNKGFALFGLITIVPARLTAAISRLNAEADLKPGSSRTLVNLATERGSNFYILFSRPRVTVRADVIEFVPDIQPQPPPAETKTSAK